MNIKHKRLLLRIMYLFIFAVSILVIINAMKLMDVYKSEAWSSIAASLAVITAVITAWNAQKIIESQEDSQRPYPYLFFDISSRYMLVQLVMKNFGGSPAYDIEIGWDKPLLNSSGKQISFGVDNKHNIDVPFLLQGEKISVLVGGANNIFSKYKEEDLNYSGSISFKDSIGQQMEHCFYLSLEKYRNNLAYSEEGLKTDYELQKIPPAINNIQKELKGIKNAIGKSSKQD
ncbi:MAG: hypothetical protein PHW73_09330 [Atribacterota bacterium]|nr:hypothetical protein [Atribacterota bacterium]